MSILLTYMVTLNKSQDIRGHNNNYVTQIFNITAPPPPVQHKLTRRNAVDEPSPFPPTPTAVIYSE